MAVRFKKSLREIKILDHTQDFNEKLLNFEFRFDPLTRRRARIMNLKFKVPLPPDVEKTVKKSLEYPCPFLRRKRGKHDPQIPFPFYPGRKDKIRRGSSVSQLYAVWTE